LRESSRLRPDASGWGCLAGAADFDGDGNPHYFFYNAVSRQTAIAYLTSNIVVNAALGPSLPAGWSLASL